LKNSLKQILRDGKFAIGACLTIGHPDIAEIIGQLGFDWVFIDMEHTAMTFETVQNLMQAMSFSGTVPIIRVPWNNPVYVKQALDIGAYGIIIPMVNTKEEAIQAVRSVRYPPLGIRGFGPRRAASNDPDYVATANQEIFLGIQIESQMAIDNLDEILSVEGIDAILLGPYDLSLNLGVLEQWESPKFKNAISKIVTAAKKHDVVMGTLASANVEKLVGQGFRIVIVDDDASILKNGEAAALESLREAIKGANLPK